MDIQVFQQTGRVPVTVIRVKGSVDASTYDAFQAAGEKVFHDGARNVLIDLTDVSYISSAGFRAISQIFKLLRDELPPEEAAKMNQGLRDGSYKSPNLKLNGPNSRVAEALRLAGFDTFLEVHHNLSEAVASF
ncbi:MAG: STAS domain-containing protein [Chloroflexi bacterium]|nr:STAS domain-containing protein [Chloroflexota bacterium]